MILKTRHIERVTKVITDIKEAEPELISDEMTLTQWVFVYARIAIELGIIEDYPAGTDIDDIHPAVAKEFGTEFMNAYDEATTIPKKNG